MFDVNSGMKRSQDILSREVGNPDQIMILIPIVHYSMLSATIQERCLAHFSP
jgi:hypothetical protein